MNERQIWTNGRRGAVVCVSVAIYEHTIVATAEPERITERKMGKALGREFPRHTFYPSRCGGDYLRMDADRWIGDGVEY